MGLRIAQEHCIVVALEHRHIGDQNTRLGTLGSDFIERHAAVVSGPVGRRHASHQSEGNDRSILLNVAGANAIEKSG